MVWNLGIRQHEKRATRHLRTQKQIPAIEDYRTFHDQAEAISGLLRQLPLAQRFPETLLLRPRRDSSDEGEVGCWCWVISPGARSAFHFIPEVFDGVGVRTLWGPVEYFLQETCSPLQMWSFWNRTETQNWKHDHIWNISMCCNREIVSTLMTNLFFFKPEMSHPSEGNRSDVVFW